MGTTWSVQVVRASEPRINLRAGIQAALDRVVSEMSPWEPDSDLCRFNAAPAGSWHELPDGFWHVLHFSLDLARRTRCAFDPAVGRMVDVWGFGPVGRHQTMPLPDDIARAAGRSGWQRIRIDEAGRRVLQPGGVQLDLCGAAKGFGVDQVAAYLRQAGATHFLVEVGGELRGEGVKPDGAPWWVALEQPSDDVGESLVALHGLACATSGDAYRSFVAGGVHYSHTIDPRAGRPIANGLASVTVLHASCMEADALATALTVLGPSEGTTFARENGIAARFVARTAGSLQEWVTPALRDMLD